MTKKIIRLKKKPTKPVRKKNVELQCPVYSGFSLESMVAWADEERAPYANVIIESDYCWDEREYYLSYTRDESDAEYALRMEAHEKRMAVYDKWYADNKAQIVEEIARRKEEEAVKEAEREEKELARKQKRYEKLKKELGLD
jgi:hypothetical protein